MTDAADGRAPNSIAALPPTTVRQIGSHQLLTDPSSVVKELIDNALDARAKSIFIDISANTIDSIQVKDDGHGIPSDDRALACRRYCTSKIRDFHDLKEVGGKWLGFRGEALASIADLSGIVSITTRVEGEPVAVKLAYQRNGELTATERDSHPVGTSVKVTKLLETARVRKDLAIKGAAKCLAKIRRMMQAYALARPTVRFRLHVLKAKNNKGDFVYAPKAQANIEDAALKIFGKECALQCDWTALELDGFELHAFLPKPAAVGSKIASHGAFISVDSRPVSSARGSFKKIATAIRVRLRKSNATLANVKDPFFSLNIICPADSYDPNIEPAKDDVIFGDEEFIVAMVNRLLASHYPENTARVGTANGTEDGISPQPDQTPEVTKPLSRPRTPTSAHQDTPIEGIETLDLAAPGQPPRWRSSMYGIDEEDLEFLQTDVPDVAEEEEGRRDVAISNPWTIARMNAKVKPRKPTNNGQLLSPAKSQEGSPTAYQSPVLAATPPRLRPTEPLTPLTFPQVSAIGNHTTNQKQQRFQGLPGLRSPDPLDLNHRPSPDIGRTHELPSFEDRMLPGFVQPGTQTSAASSSLASSAPMRRKPRPQHPFRGKSYVQPSLEADDTWFGQPLCNAPRTVRPQKRSQQQARSFFPRDDTFNAQQSLVLPAAERLTASNLTSENNTDMRDFLVSSRRAPVETSSSVRTGDTVPQTGSAAQIPPRRPQSADSCHPSSTAQEMSALFDLHHTSPDEHSSPIRKSRSSRKQSSPASRSASLPHRRRSSVHRTKSSTLPLNFTPRGFETHTLTLHINTSASLLAQQARKMDMSANVNTLEWGYAADSTEAFDVFGTAISERSIVAWMSRVEVLLDAVYEKRDGVAVGRVLYEGMRGFLDVRRDEGDAVRCGGGADTFFPVETESIRGAVSKDARSERGDAVPPAGAGAAMDTDGMEAESDFEYEQFIDFDDGGCVKTEGGERGDGVDTDDEMLMDL